MSDSISVTRALVKLKTLNERITNLTSKSSFIGLKKNNKNSKDIKIDVENFQAIADLLNHRDDLRKKIIECNHNTKVKVCGKEYSVAEAIAMKNDIELRQKFLNELKNQNMKIQREYEFHNEEVQRKLDNLLETSFSRDVKQNADTMENVIKTYRKSNEAEIVDPLKLSDHIDRMEDEINGFLKEIDFVLSESNATTHIVI